MMRLVLWMWGIGCACSLLSLTSARAGVAPDGDTNVARPWSQRIAGSFLARHPGAVTYDDGLPGDKWTYEQGLMLEAFRRMWIATGDTAYAAFIRKNIDHFVGADGSIRTYKAGDLSLDNIAGGRALIFLYQETGEEKYKAAAGILRTQLRNQPRTREGGFWHKKIYPYQMWLDGLYMAEPFYASYAHTFGDEGSFDDIANQFAYMYRHARDPQTGLCYHGWDETKAQRWADSSTGCSPTFWGRAMGWYVMGLVDVLDLFPQGHPRREELIGILRSMAAAIVQYRDSTSGMWYQVVDQPGRAGNYLESSASSMFTYALAKGANMGYIDSAYASVAAESFRGITAHAVTVDARGLIDLHETCRGTGLGGIPYRSGSYAYYVGVERATNDMKGIGPFLLAAIEVEKSARRGR